MSAAEERTRLGSVLVIDDEEHLRRVLSVMLGRRGWEVFTAGGGLEGLEVFQAQRPDLVVVDLKMPDINGIEVLERIRALAPEQTVIMITAYASVETALKAMKAGAFDYIGKPFREEEILLVLEKAAERQRLVTENARLMGEIASRYDFSEIIGASEPMQRVFGLMKKVAATMVTVLISGESGTGKELVAQAIHYASERGGRPLVAVNCAAIPPTLIESELFGAAKGAYTGAERSRKGLIEEADGSTLFLDEVGELPLEVQAKLLRALQEGEYRRVGETAPRHADFRLIAAGNKDLTEEVSQGRFREDLYYRLAVVTIHLPPLRERGGDIARLAEHFLARSAARHGLGDKRLSPAALAALAGAPLKGNVRELENLIEQAYVLSDGAVIEPDDLPVAGAAPARGGVRVWVDQDQTDLKKVLKLAGRQAEEQVIGRALAAVDGNRTKAAEALGISRRALITKIQELGLD